MKEVYLKIEGRVQRVGFRRWAVMKAAAIGGVSGWVRNESDGSVEIFMSGEDRAVNEMVQSCYQGPLFARVDKVSFLPEAGYGLPPVKEGRFVRI
ncbi:MAG: acylphosphatase [Alphaproteobacteria bacterium]|nr:acylphosphatase [Alphaproteobacteria bacterium]